MLNGYFHPECNFLVTLCYAQYDGKSSERQTLSSQRNSSIVLCNPSVIYPLASSSAFNCSFCSYPVVSIYITSLFVMFWKDHWGKKLITSHEYALWSWASESLSLHPSSESSSTWEQYLPPTITHKFSTCNHSTDVYWIPFRYWIGSFFFCLFLIVLLWYNWYALNHTYLKYTIWCLNIFTHQWDHYHHHNSEHVTIYFMY